MNKKISVVVPAYNYEQYTERAIKSLLNQTYKNIEVIAVDDGSTDQTGRILDEIASTDNRLIVIHQKNGGIGIAIKTAMEYITGEYTAFMDLDDYMDIDAYENLIAVMEENEADIVESGVKDINPDGEIMGKLEYKNETITGTDAILHDYFFVNKSPHLSTKFICTRLLKNCVIFGRSAAIDEITSIQLMEQCHKLVKIDKCFYNAVRYKNSVSRAVIDGVKLQEQLLSDEDIVQLLSKQNAKSRYFYAIDVLKKYAVLYYKYKKKEFGHNSDIKNFSKTIKKQYNKIYSYVDFSKIKNAYPVTTIWGIKLFRFWPFLFVELYGPHYEKNV